MPIRLKLQILSACLILTAGLRPGLAGEVARPLQMGVMPFLAAEQLEDTFGPVAVAIGQTLQRPVKLRTRSSFDEYSKALAEKQFDIALVQPFDYVNMADRGDYQPLVRLKEPLTAILVVSADSPVLDMMELRGQIIVLPPATAAVSLLVGPMLKQAGLSATNDVRLVYTQSHDACMLEVLKKRAAACITARLAMQLYASRRNLTFRILAESEKFPAVLYVVRSDFPAVDRARLSDMLTQWSVTESGRQLLARAGIGGDLVPALDSEYDIVRRMRDAMKIP